VYLWIGADKPEFNDSGFFVPVRFFMSDSASVLARTCVLQVRAFLWALYVFLSDGGAM
jgi:hypothetical protein